MFVEIATNECLYAHYLGLGWIFRGIYDILHKENHNNDVMPIFTLLKIDILKTEDVLFNFRLI